jgi:hypothetical protein
MTFKTFLATVMAGLAIVASTGCEEKSSDSDSDDGNATGGTGKGGKGGSAGSGGAGLAGSGAGPAITTAPPAWVRPADCGGIGDLCADLSGCGALSVCQLEGYVCIPALEPGATSLPGRTAETPYCAAYTCMTFDEASCFCTGEAGANYPSCSSPSALAGICVGPDASCATRACCDGLTCLNNGSYDVCKQGCTTAADCSTGCCTDVYDTGVLTCAELDACTNPCKREGEACTPGTSTTPNDCCRGSCVESENPDYAGCRPTCTTNDQCDTGCCVPFSNTNSGFCAAALYCSCGAQGASCGELMDPLCCDGTTCAGQTAETASCRKLCTSDADCGGTVCRPLSDNSASICDETCAMLDAACGPGNPNCCSGMTCAGSEAGGYTCFVSCDDPSDCPTGECVILSDGVSGICQEPPMF